MDCGECVIFFVFPNSTSLARLLLPLLVGSFQELALRSEYLTTYISGQALDSKCGVQRTEYYLVLSIYRCVMLFV